MMTTSASAAMEAALTPQGESLAALSQRTPVLVVFLRHGGCAFCREALADLAEQRAAIEKSGARICLVHMIPTEAAAVALFSAYRLADLPRIADPDRKLYAAFDLARGSANQVLGPQVWWRGFKAMFLEGHLLGVPSGDIFQLPGAFLIHRGEIVRAFRHQTSADRPDYQELACPLPNAGTPAAGETGS